MESKYIKPSSRTWWGGMIAILTAILIAVSGAYDLGPFGAVVEALAGDASPALLFSFGLSVIGFRGFLGETADK